MSQSCQLLVGGLLQDQFRLSWVSLALEGREEEERWPWTNLLCLGSERLASLLTSTGGGTLRLLGGRRRRSDDEGLGSSRDGLCKVLLGLGLNDRTEFRTGGQPTLANKTTRTGQCSRWTNLSLHELCGASHLVLGRQETEYWVRGGGVVGSRCWIRLPFTLSPPTTTAASIESPSFDVWSAGGSSRTVSVIGRISIRASYAPSVVGRQPARPIHLRRLPHLARLYRPAPASGAFKGPV